MKGHFLLSLCLLAALALAGCLGDDGGGDGGGGGGGDNNAPQTSSSSLSDFRDRDANAEPLDIDDADGLRADIQAQFGGPNDTPEEP